MNKAHFKPMRLPSRIYTYKMGAADYYNRVARLARMKRAYWIEKNPHKVEFLVTYGPYLRAENGVGLEVVNG